VRGHTHAHSIAYADADTHADADTDIDPETVRSCHADAGLAPETVRSFLPNSSAYASATDTDADADPNTQPDCGSNTYASTVLSDIVGGRPARRARRAGHHIWPVILNCTVRQHRHQCTAAHRSQPR
jgi:hypothetical protein